MEQKALTKNINRFENLYHIASNSDHKREIGERICKRGSY